MPPALAVLDTDVIVLLLTPPSSLIEGDRVRQAGAHHWVKVLSDQGVRWVVPTPVISELYKHGDTGPAVRRIVGRALTGVHTQALTLQCAAAAGLMAKHTLEQRRPGQTRGAVKYDALIAGTAHAIGAKWLVTDNGKDFRRCLAAVRSPVELVVVSEGLQKAPGS